jgi:hypothetical protein
MVSVAERPTDSGWFSEGIGGGSFQPPPKFCFVTRSEQISCFGLLKITSFIIHYFGWQARSRFVGIVRDGTICSSGLPARNAPNDLPGPWSVSRYLSCLVLMAQTTLDEWFGLYSSNTREIEMFAFKWSQRLHSQRPNQGTKVVGRRSKKQAPCLVGRGVRRNPYPYRDNFHPLRSSAVRKRLRARRRAR